MYNDKLLGKIMMPMEIIGNIVNERILGKWGNIPYFFNIYRNRYFKKGINLISLSYFSMDKPDALYAEQRGIKLEEYEKVYKKKKERYINGLKTIIKKNKKEKLYTTIRIYCDYSSIELVKNFLRNKYVEVYYYFIPPFFDYEKMVHFQFYGTLMRYLPLFKIKYHNNNEWENTIILDVDTIYKDEPPIIRYFINKKKLSNLLFMNTSCNYLSPRIGHFNTNLPYFSIMSGLIIQKKTQDFKIFINFLNNCLLKKCYHYETFLQKYLLTNLNNRVFNGKLEYGVDEYFINIYFLKKLYIDKNNNFLEVFIKEKKFPLNNWIINIKKYQIKFSHPKVVEKFLKFIIKTFTIDFTIPKYVTVYDLIEIIYNELFHNPKYFNIYYKKSDYVKLYKIVKKIEPKTLEMPDNILFCLKRYTDYYPKDMVVKIVKPNKKYPNFTEDIYDFIKITN